MTDTSAAGSDSESMHVALALDAQVCRSFDVLNAVMSQVIGVVASKSESGVAELTIFANTEVCAENALQCLQRQCQARRVDTQLFRRGCDQVICGDKNVLRVRLLDSNDDIDVIRRTCGSKFDSEQQMRRSLIATAKYRGLAPVTEEDDLAMCPNLLFVVSRSRTLLRFPCWLLKQAEIAHCHDVTQVQFSLRDALRRYACTELRCGR